MKIIALSGDVGWEITANGVRDELKSANGGDVEFHINSPGGFVSEGIEIYNIIRAYKGGTTAVITGLAASMGSYIPLACDRVVAYDNAIYMIHNAWNFAIGDHNDMRKVADMLEGISNIIANAYVKKTGSTLDKIKDFMDDDTFFFGAEMQTEGFVDEMIEGGSESDADADDKASAIVKARASMDVCLKRIRESDAANADIEKAVAYFNGMSALIDAPKKPVKPVAVAAPGTTNTPAVAGQGKQEDKNMTFEEYLAANPVAQKAYDVAIAKAYTDGEAAAKDAMKAVVAKVEPILKSPDYPDSVKAFGAQVLTGEKTVDGFEAVVFMEDQRIEAVKAAAALAESEGTEETPGAAAGSDAVKDAEAKAKFDEKKKRMEQGV